MVSGGRGGAWKAPKDRLQAVLVEGIFHGTVLKLARDALSQEWESALRRRRVHWS